MSVFAGPEISQNGLIFAFDMGNSLKSWKGAPITNEAKNASNQIDWVIGNLDQAVSISTITPNESYYISSSSLTGTSFRIYFSNAVLTNGATYTVSYKYRIISGGPLFFANDWCDTAITRVTTDLGAGVFYETATGTRATYDVTYRFLDLQISNNTVVQIWDLQLELGSFATPYSSTRIRSNTQAILDLTNISTVTVNGLNYTSGNYATINGTSSYIAITNSVNLRPSSELTIEYIIKGPNEASWRPILGYGNGDYGNGNYLVWTEGGTLNSLCRINNGGTVTEYRQYPGVTISSTTYQQMTFTMKVGQSIRSYRNGVDTNTPTSLPAEGSFHYPGTTSPYQIGGLGSAWLVADVPFVRLYNRALSASEIQQNFNALRGRFGI